MALDDPAIAAAFLERFLEDRDRGRVRELADYQAEFPDHAELVAREFALCTTPADEPAAEDGPATNGLFTIGSYRALAEIGRGGQGAVYLAEDTRLARRVALKVLSGLGSEEHLARFRREAAVASRLDHPGICAVYESGTDSGRAFIAMRWIDGQSLADSIAHARDAGEREVAIDSATEPREQRAAIVRFFEQAARALHAAHEAGIVHRDVKPGNLLIAPDGQPVVCDFGLAREEDSDHATLTRTGDVFGTPAYMSPEQLGGLGRQLDRRTDVWSLGVALFESLTLRLPFEAPTRDGLYQKILRDPPTDARHHRPDVARDLAVVLATALENDRDRRYRTALDLAEDLRRVREHEPIRARPAGPGLRLVRWAQRNPALGAALFSLFVLLTASLGLTSWFLQRAERDKLELAEMNRDLEIALDDAREGRASKREKAIHAHVEAGYQALFSFPHTDSATHFEQALALDARNKAALAGLFWSAWNEPEDALARLDRWAVGALADDPDVHWMRGLIHRSAGRDDEAGRWFAQAGSAETHLRTWLEGLRAVRSFEPPTPPEDAARGLELFRKAALRAPRPQFHYVHSQMMAAQIAGDRRALDEAAISMEAHWSDSPFALEAIAQFYFSLDVERAERALQRLIEIEPNGMMPLLGLAQIEQGRGDTDRALEYFDRAVDGAPDVGQARLLRGTLYVELERFDEARADLARSIELLPEYPPVYELLATACRAIGGDERVAQEFEQLVLQDPSRRTAWRFLAAAARELGDREREIDALVGAIGPEADVGESAETARSGDESALDALRRRAGASR